MSAIAVPILVCMVSLLPKNMTLEPMMAMRFTTLHTPWLTGLTRPSVLKANCGGGGADAARRGVGGSVPAAARAAAHCFGIF